MKKFLGICLILSSLIIISSIIYVTYLRNNTVKTGDLNIVKTALKADPDFAWGVTTSAYQFDGYIPETAQKQVDILNQLGVNTIRMTLERNILSLRPFSVKYDEQANDGFVDKLYQNKTDIVMVIDGDILNTANLAGFDQEASGYQMGKYAASRYKGKVKYYQLANEVTGTAVKPSDPNFKGPIFDCGYGINCSTDNYNSLLGWLKGLQKGIKEADPQAKIVITGHWHLFAVIDKLIKDGINPDVIGWAWYSDDGLDPTRRDVGGGEIINPLDKLKSFGKLVWIVEMNSVKGSYNDKTKKVDENYQADFFKKFIPNLLSSGKVDGIFAFPLFDTPIFALDRGDSEAHWGLVKVTKDSSGSPSFTPKKAFNIYRDFISAN